MNQHHAVLLRVLDTKTYQVPKPDQNTSQAVFQAAQFGISDARTLIAAANRTPEGQATTQQIVVVTSFITIEAQQALLKIIEEPPTTTIFLFVLPTSLQLLPTLLSRFSLGDSPEVVKATATCDLDPFTAFLEAEVTKRIEHIETAIKNKDSVWQSDIKCGLIAHLQEKPGMYTKTRLESLGFVASTLLTRGASNKMLLEELALTL